LLYLASWLDSREKKGFQVKSKGRLSETLTAFLIILGIIGIILVLQPDLSTFGVILMSALLMFFLAKTPFWQTILILFIILVILVPLIKYAPYRLNRFLVFLNPDLEPMEGGYQLKQALIAVGSGGISGVGLGLSEQKYGFLPQSISDSIFAIFAEETGFLGSIILISLFIIFFIRGFKIGKEKKDVFSRLTAFGITSWIVLQAFINMGAMIGILPLTGIPLPFVSYGGSALISELAGVGILLNISKR
jgi:cell division protein FtsW